jgi:hypothetical protein
MSSIIKNLALFGLAALFVPCSSAVATTLDLDFSAGTFHPRYYQAGSNAGAYTYASWFDLSDLTVSLNTDTGVANVAGDFSGDLKDRAGNVIGTSVASLDLTFSGLTINPDVGDPNNPIYALGVEGTSTSSGEYFFQLDFANGRREAETLDVFGGFALVGANHATFGDIAGTSFNFMLRENGGFDIWVKSLMGKTFTLSHEPFNLHGDIHGKTAVPEPATMLLLGAGVLGGALKRKKLV